MLSNIIDLCDMFIIYVRVISVHDLNPILCKYAETVLPR
jgi:hypothetical protein